MKARFFGLLTAAVASGAVVSNAAGLIKEDAVVLPAAGAVLQTTADITGNGSDFANMMGKLAAQWPNSATSFNQQHGGPVYDFSTIAIDMTAQTLGVNTYDVLKDPLNSSLIAGHDYLVLHLLNPVTTVVNASGSIDVGFIGFENWNSNILGIQATQGLNTDSLALFGPYSSQPTQNGMGSGAARLSTQTAGDPVTLDFWGTTNLTAADYTTDGSGTYVTNAADKHMMTNTNNFMGMSGNVRTWDGLNFHNSLADTGAYLLLGHDDVPGGLTDWDDGVILARLEHGQITPEPASIAFMGLIGLVGFVAYRRRGKKA